MKANHSTVPSRPSTSPNSPNRTLSRNKAMIAKRAKPSRFLSMVTSS